MALTRIKRDIDLQPGLNAPAVFHCSQGDVGSTIMLGLLDGGEAPELISGATVKIKGSRSNGEVFSEVTASLSDSTVTFALTAEMTATPGPTWCEAVLTKNSDILGTANFVLDVEESPTGAAPRDTTDATWSWILTKMASEDVDVLGGTVIEAINDKADALTTNTNIAALVSSGATISDDLYTYTAKTATATSQGYRLKGVDGIAVANADFNILKFPVTAGTQIRIVSDDRYQFQTSSTVPTTTTHTYIVGSTCGALSGVVTVPAGATYLIMSTPASGGAAAVYDAELKIDKDRIPYNFGVSAIESHTSCDDVTENSWMYISASGGVTTLSNFAFSANGWLQTINIPESGGNILQIAYPWAPDRDERNVSVRTCKSGTWTNWIEISPDPDDTLTEDGIPANAKTVGDIIITPVVTEFAGDGYYNANGSIASATTRNEKYTDRIYGMSFARILFSFSSAQAGWIGIATYDANGNFIERIGGNLGEYSSFTRDYVFDDNVDSFSVSLRTFDGLQTFVIEGSKKAEYIDAVNTKVETNPAYNVFRFQPYYDHFGIENVDEQDETKISIPNQSLANIEMSSRMGFNVIEANLAETSDGYYICYHGDTNGNWGYDVTDTNGNDINTTAINANTLAWVKANVRYRAKYARYRVAPLELSEFLYACRRCNMIPLVRYRGSSMMETLNEIMGKDNYILYQGTRAQTNGMIMQYSASYTSIADIKEYCSTFTPPFMFNLGNPSTFSDADLLDLAEWMHKKGFLVGFCGCYTNENITQKLLGMGYDFSASGYNVPPITHGNLYNVTSDVDFSGFTTNGTDNGTYIHLDIGESINFVGAESPFASGATLVFKCSGNAYVTMGASIDRIIVPDAEINRISTVFHETTPQFRIKALDNAVDVYYIGFHAGEY